MRDAKSVQVISSILDLELGSDLEAAHKKLDPLSAPDKPPKEDREKEGEGGERKVLWQLASTEYSALFVKTDEKGRIHSITAFLREGKEIPFDKIGQDRRGEKGADKE